VVVVIVVKKMNNVLHVVLFPMQRIQYSAAYIGFGMPKRSRKMNSPVSDSCPIGDAGARCSVSGKNYEIKIAKTCKTVRSPYLEIPFNTQPLDTLGGCGADIDIKLNWRTEGDIGVEAKRPTPDWMQMKLEKNKEGVWVGVSAGKIPAASKTIFETIIGAANLFGGKTPTFLERPVTYSEWTDIKKSTPEFKDYYIPCGANTISQLYKAKGCQYIQVDGKGLYHTGEDTCDFGVPYFECPQRIRIRLKVHTRKNKKGNMCLSVMAAAQPIKLKELVASKFSLDAAAKLPSSLAAASSAAAPSPKATSPKTEAVPKKKKTGSPSSVVSNNNLDGLVAGMDKMAI